MPTANSNKEIGREVPRVNHKDPKFIRLPKQGDKCEWTGLGRSKMSTFLLATKENGFSPPVKSLSLGPKQGSKGVRLVHFDSLMDYLNSLLEEGGK
jgi:hypothetical protein